MDEKYLSKLFERAEEAVESAKKLTTKQRKRMKKSTFCGPGRSFPVPDCKHVAVAKAYLGRSKFSQSTKKKIAACINRKAKQLGCDVSKKAKADEGGTLDEVFPKYIELNTKQKQLYSSDIFVETKELVDKSIEIPDLELFSEDEDEKNI